MFKIYKVLVQEKLLWMSEQGRPQRGEGIWAKPRSFQYVEKNKEHSKQA